MAPGLLVDDSSLTQDHHHFYPTNITPNVPTQPQPQPQPQPQSHSAPENTQHSIFPDGIRTSGQHPPLYEKLRPYADFPTKITGPTVWSKEEFENSPEKWARPFTQGEIAELGRAADEFIASGRLLTGISKVLFRLFQ
jgi:hypothetical protein